MRKCGTCSRAEAFEYFFVIRVDRHDGADIISCERGVISREIIEAKARALCRFEVIRGDGEVTTVVRVIDAVAAAGIVPICEFGVEDQVTVGVFVGGEVTAAFMRPGTRALINGAEKQFRGCVLRESCFCEGNDVWNVAERIEEEELNEV